MPIEKIDENAHNLIFENDEVIYYMTTVNKVINEQTIEHSTIIQV